MGLDPLPTYIAAVRVRRSATRSWRRGFRSTLISSPAHQFLNSTFVNIDVAAPQRARAGVPAASRPTPSARGIARGHARGRCTTTAARSPRSRAWSDRIREGVVWAPSIWWGKLAADGANANQTTSQRETDMGHGPVFYDNQVEVEAA